MAKPVSLLTTYIYLAIGCGSLGIAITFVVLFISLHYGIDISQNLWVLAIPVTLSLFLNVLFIELYTKYKKK
jgi:hypothetical protein